SPMLGFGAGAYLLALAHREGTAIDPACGAFYEDDGGSETGDDTGGSSDDDGGSGVDDSSGDDASGDASASGVTQGGTLSAGDDDDGSSDESEGTGMNDDSGGCGCTSGGPRSGLGMLAIGVLALLRRRRRAALAALLGAAACGGGDDAQAIDASSSSGDIVTTITPTASEASATVDPDTTGADSTNGSTDDSASEDDSGGTTGGTEVDECPSYFHFASDDPSITAVRVVGEWQDFDLTSAPALFHRVDWEDSVPVPPGTWAYKLVIERDGAAPDWILDPEQTRRKYVDEVENSAMLVRDCNLPTLAVEQYESTRPGADEGRFTARVRYDDGFPQDGIDLESVTAVLRHDFEERALEPGEIVVDQDDNFLIAVDDLPDGKHTLVLGASDLAGRTSAPLRMPFWIEAEPFDYNGALVYMAMADRFRNGDEANDPGPTPGADMRGDFAGGDLQGLRQSIDDGTLDALGVRAIWVSPFNTNPEGAYLAADGVHLVTGYHGYWPTRSREVDARIGGEDALRELVASAHAHGIRVLQDFVINHVHEDHEYVAEHPEWFRTGCVCGTDGCDWTA
ncbi:MAG: hypothetical protein IAG13_36090, partial [Deltaproteobacteria bacterium]|nr:hypothetical protein [Nannocystaceae bacterium]